MVSRGVKGLVHVSLGIGVVGVLGVNIATRVIQIVRIRRCPIWVSPCLSSLGKHRKQDYCTVPLKLAQQNTKCVQLLGGGTMKMKNLNLKTAVAKDTEFKMAITIRSLHRKKQAAILEGMASPKGW